MKDLEIYEIEGLSDQQRKELLKRARGWMVVGKRTAAKRRLLLGTSY